MLRSLIYASSSTIEPDENLSHLDRIVVASQRHNPALDVTGALVFTGSHFVQILEGSADALAILMAKIETDERHERIEVLHETDIAERSFGEWSMAYAGPSTYLAEHLRPLLSQGSSDPRAPDAVERLIIVMQEFSLDGSAKATKH